MANEPGDTLREREQTLAHAKSLEQENRLMFEQLFAVQRQLEQCAHKLRQEEDRARLLDARLASMLASTSWRVTKPLRSVRSLVRRLLRRK